MVGRKTQTEKDSMCCKMVPVLCGDHIVASCPGAKLSAVSRLVGVGARYGTFAFYLLTIQETQAI